LGKFLKLTNFNFTSKFTCEKRGKGWQHTEAPGQKMKDAKRRESGAVRWVMVGKRWEKSRRMLKSR